MDIAIGFALIGCALVWILRPLFSAAPVEGSSRSPSDPAFAILEDQRQTLFANLKDLDVEFQMGRLDKRDYEDLRKGMMVEIAEIIKEMKAAGGGREKSVGQSTAALLCSLCRHEARPGDRFCSRCGARFEKVSLLVFLFLLSSLFFTPLSRASSEERVILGKITNQTTGKPGSADSVRLLQFGEGMEEIETLAKVDREFRFDASKLIPSRPYMLQLLYRGVNYNHPFQIPEQGPIEIPLAVFETTSSEEGIRVSLPHLLMRAREAKLDVLWAFEVLNETDPPQVFYNLEGTFRLDLPEGLAEPPEVVFTRGEMPIAANPSERPDGDGYLLRNPIKPGRSMITVSYSLDYADKDVSFETKVFYDFPELQVLVAPSDVHLESPLFQLEGKDEAHGFSQYRSGKIEKGMTLEFHVSGGSSLEEPSLGQGEGEAGEPRLISVPAPVDRYRWAILSGLGGIFLAATAIYLSKDRKN